MLSNSVVSAVLAFSRYFVLIDDYDICLSENLKNFVDKIMKMETGYVLRFHS